MKMELQEEIRELYGQYKMIQWERKMDRYEMQYSLDILKLGCWLKIKEARNGDHFLILLFNAIVNCTEIMESENAGGICIDF